MFYDSSGSSPLKGFREGSIPERFAEHLKNVSIKPGKACINNSEIPVCPRPTNTSYYIAKIYQNPI